MPMSAYLQNLVLQATLQGESFTLPSSVYLGLHTTDPTIETATALSTEISGNGYSRVAITFTDPNGSYITENVATVTFSPATPLGHGTIYYISLWDAISTGNLLYYGALSSPVAIASGESFSMVSGGLQIKYTT